MSLARAAFRGSFWTITTSIGARAIGVFGTLLLTRFLSPASYGEVTAASVLVLSLSQLSSIGAGQYLVSHPHASRETTFHVTLFHLVLGAIALGAAWAFRAPLAALTGTPEVAAYVPGLVLSALLDRIAYVPERLLVRDMQFRYVGLARTGSDLAYSTVSVGLASLGLGGNAVVLGNVARSAVRLVSMSARARWADWLTPCRLSLAHTRKIVSFGLPVAFASSASFASRRWDNLIIARLFGPGVLGAYNLAYNLADIPATQVGEQISDVLLPSFARIPPERRPAALRQSLTLLALLMLPLAVGLGAIAPTLVSLLFDERWASVGPMLAVLAAMSAARPVGGAAAAYLQAIERTGLLMAIELSTVAVLLATMLASGALGPLWLCGSIGVVFAGNSLALLAVIHTIEGQPLAPLLLELARPALAAAPMAVAVTVVRHVLPAGSPGWLIASLMAQLFAGAAVYAAAAWAFAPRASRDLLTMARDALARQRHAVATAAR